MNDQKARQTAFAIVKDGRRRGGVRVVRVWVRTRLDFIGAAEVQEIAWPVRHWLRFDHLSTRGGLVIREKIRAVISRGVQLNTTQHTLPTRVRHYGSALDGYQPESFADNAPQTTVAAPAGPAAP